MLCMVSEFQKEEHGQSVKMLCVPVFHTSCDTFWLAVTFSHVLHLGVFRRLKLKVKTMYGYEAEPPIAIPIYTVLPYRVIPGWKSKLMLIITPDSAQ